MLHIQEAKVWTLTVTASISHCVNQPPQNLATFFRKCSHLATGHSATLIFGHHSQKWPSEVNLHGSGNNHIITFSVQNIIFIPLKPMFGREWNKNYILDTKGDNNIIISTRIYISPKNSSLFINCRLIYWVKNLPSTKKTQVRIPIRENFFWGWFFFFTRNS